MQFSKTTNEITTPKKEKTTIYQTTDSLLNSLFDTKLKFIDFKNETKTKPYFFGFLNQIGLNNIRGYLSPKFDETYVSKNSEDYILFIFEYKNSSFAEKAFLEYNTYNDKILQLIKNNLGHPSEERDVLTTKALKISSFCKGGGMFFKNDKFIINIIKTCRLPPALKKMKWKEYEDLFLNVYLGKKDVTTLVLTANCGARNYEKEYFKK